MEPVTRLKPRVEHWPNGHKKLEGQYLVAAEGVWRRWYVNGQLEEEVTLVAGVRHGPYKVWNAQGGLVTEGAFADGKPDGRWRSWRGDGALVSETVYDHGAVVSAVRAM
jgi:antitoxin component YwqK of YwqJK toxin-antitoxin module